MPIKQAIGLGLFAASLDIGIASTHATARTLRVHVDSFKNGGSIPNKYAFCVRAAQGHTGAGADISPSL